MMKISHKKISMVTLGCAKNLVDSEILIGGLKQESYDIVQKSDDADILIINTCGFLDSAREESVDVILEAGKLKKTKQVEKLVVMGCFSERFPKELKNTSKSRFRKNNNIWIAYQYSLDSNGERKN